MGMKIDTEIQTKPEWRWNTHVLIIKWLIDFIFIYIWHDEGIYRKEQIESEFPDINVYNK